MYVTKATRWRSCLAVVLALVMLAAIYVPQAEAADMIITWFEPAADLVSNDENGVYYKVTAPIEPDAVHFKWNFGNGMDRPIVAGSLQNVTLKNKNTNEEVPLDRGNPTGLDANGILLAGDFKFTKKGGGGGTGGELRLLEMILKSTTLQSGTTYIVELGPNLEANNGSTLGKPYSWEFTTGGVTETDPPAWPDKSLNISNLSPQSLDLSWSSAEDSSGVRQYKIFKDQVELATVDATTLNYRVTGLTPDTEYTFKVEASDSVNWSTDGPSVSVKTPGLDNVAPAWPEGSKLECTTIGEKTVTLQWTAAEDNYRVISYKIYKDGQDPITVKGSATTCEVTGLTGNTSYNFKVEAGDEAGNWTDNGPSLTVTTISDATPPNWSEATLSVKNLAADTLTLEWTAAQDNIGVVGYQVYQDGNLIETVKDATAYNVTGLEPTTEYTFKVEAFDEAGNTSSDGPTTTVTTPRWNPTAGAGFNFTLTAPASTNVSLDNTLVYNNVDGFVDGESCYFCWDFENSLDETVYLQNITLKKKDNGEIIPLTAADFKYTRQDEPERIRRLELNLTSTKLAANTSYVIELGPDFSVNSGAKLGRTYCWGFQTWPGITPPVCRLDGGYYHSVFLDDNGNVWAWGKNDYGQLGNGFIGGSNWYTPVKVEGLTGITAVASGWNHNLALKDDGTVWAWGENIWGQIGDGTKTARSIPVQVNGLTDVIKISCNVSQSLALKADGTVWAWGDNWWGQLGDGLKDNKTTPVKIEGLTDIADIASGGEHSMALKKDGTVWCWGHNDYGQLGDNTVTDSFVPVQPNITRVVQIAGGHRHSLALKEDGTVWTWGGVKRKPSIPSQVSGLSGVIDLNASNNFSVVLTDDGTSHAFGPNDKYFPQKIGNMTELADIGLGYFHSLALKKDGSIWAVGYNYSGQLGNGNNINQTTPVKALLDFTDTTSPEWPEGSQLTADNPTYNSVALSWTPAAEDTLAYKIFKNDTVVAMAGANTTTYNVTGLEDDTEYTFKVEARDASGNYSNNGPSTTVATVPAPPSLLEAKTSASGSMIKLTFDKAMNNPAGKQGEFQVLVDGIVNPVTEVKLDYNTSLIKLVLTDVVPIGATVTVSYTQGTVSSVKNVLLESFTGQAVVNEVATQITGDTDISADGSNQSLFIGNNTPESVTINVPAEVTGATISVESKLNEPQGDTVTTGALPELNISATTSISPTNPVQVNIPAGTTIIAPAGWDGTLELPKVQANDSVTVTPDAGKKAAVNRVIEIGCGDTALNFDKAVKIVIPGEKGKEIGFVRGGVFQKIDTVLTATTQEAVDAELLAKNKVDGKQDQDNDLVIWTKHFTSFVTYTQTSTGSGDGGSDNGGNGGGGGDGSGDNKDKQAFSVEKFTLVKNSSSSYTLRFDLSNGMDREIPGNLSKVHVYKKSDRTLIPYTSYNYIKQGTRENPPKIRRLELTFDNVFKDGESYLVEIDPDFTANNGNTFGKMYTTEFTIGAGGAVGTGDTTKGGLDVKEPGKVVNLIDIKGHWAEKAIEELVATGAVAGYPDGTFKPDQGISRAEFASMVVKAFKLEPKSGKVFEDTANHWAREAIATAAAYGIVSGYSETNFGADDSITREQMAAMVVRAAKLTEVTADNKFTDNDKISAWAKKAVATASESRIISGYPDNTFRPQAGATRAEAVTVIAKAS